MTILRGAALALLIAGPVHAEPVVLGLTVPLGAQYSDLAYGMELGFFEEEGLELSIVSFQGAPVAMAQVANKSVDFAMGDLILAVNSLERNAALPVKFVHNYQRSTIHGMIVPEDSEITEISQLAGKKLGVYALNAASISLTKSVLASEGIDGQVELLPIGLGPAAWSQMTSGNVAGLNFWTSEFAKITIAGIPYRKLDYSAEYQPIFSSAIVAHDDMIAANPEKIVGFARAVAKSDVACKTNLEACAKAFWKLDPSSRPSPENEEKWVADTVTLLTAQQESIHNFFGEPERWGYIPPQAFEGAVRVLTEAGQVTSKDLDADKIITNQFVEEINKFDPEAVKELARNSS